MGMNMEKYFMITGMFRSGTTLFSKILNAHDEIVCVPDMFTPFFNAFRDKVANKMGLQTEPLRYIGDYFADEKQLMLLKQNLKASLEMKFERTADEKLLKRLKARGRLTCPRIAENLNSLQGETYKEAYQDLIDYIPKYYGNGKEKLIGNKEVWVTEFLPALAEAYPKAKFILVNRDPRAVCASKNVASVKGSQNVHNEKYPWLFLIRQWRKLAILAWVFKEFAVFKDRLLYLQYEDLLRSPEETIREMCNFLEIHLDKKMLNPQRFIDGKGKKWIQNSSYNCIDKDDGFLVFKDKNALFDTTRIDKWKEVLGLKELEFIEQLCFPEMKLFGYEFYGSGKLGIPDKILFDAPMIDVTEMQNWIQKHYQDRTKVTQVNELSKEKLRQQMLIMPDEVAHRLDPKIIESYFVDVRYYDKVRGLLGTSK